MNNAAKNVNFPKNDKSPASGGDCNEESRVPPNIAENAHLEESDIRLSDGELLCSSLFSQVPTYLAELFDSVKYPWELLPKLRDYILKLIKDPPAGFHALSPDVVIGEGVKIDEGAKIIGPAFIGPRTEIRLGGFIRGGVIIGADCVIGNSCELKNCLLLDGATIPHFNYVGDSVIGNRAHLGAGAICSNLKSDKSDVTVRGKTSHKTHLRKLGAILGDGADVGASCVLNPGTVIGKRSSVYPLTALRGTFREDLIIKSPSVAVKRIQKTKK